MGKTKPDVIVQQTDEQTYRTEQVLKAETIYAVCFQGVPINIRDVSFISDYPGPRYKRSSFPSRGHAIKLAKRLNKKFKTNRFEVYKMTRSSEPEKDET